MRNKVAVDLHLHSNYSDGEDSIRNLVLLVKATAEQKFGDSLDNIVISISDHDTLIGQREALEWGKAFDLGIIPAAELTTMHERQNPHILFYFDPARLEEVENNNEIKMLFKRNAEIRKEKDRRILRGLRKKFNISYHELELVKPKNSIGGTPYIVKVLLKKYHDLEKHHIDDIFKMVKGIEKSTRYDSSLRYPDLIAVTKILRMARVVPVLAHPLLDDLRSVRGIEHAFIMLGGGLGIERYYPYQAFKRTSNVDLMPYQREIDRLCEDNNLVRTGGSDYHGRHFRDERKLFEVEVSGWVADKLLEKIEDVERGKI